MRTVGVPAMSAARRVHLLAGHRHRSAGLWRLDACGELRVQVACKIALAAGVHGASLNKKGLQ